MPNILKMNYENILIEHNEAIATVTINRPAKLNALNKATIAELHHAFAALEMNPEVSVIVLTGSGEKAFVAGADISEFAHFSVEQGAELSAQGQQLLFDFVENLKTPVIAAVGPFRDLVSFCDATSQIFMVMSALAEAKVFPSGEKATL